MKRIGVFGGSFNPIHNGHLQLSRAILAHGLVEEVWLMVSPRNPLKKSEDLIDENMRLILVEKAVEGEKNIHASDFEFKLARPSYTWQTLAALRRVYPEHEFSLVIGADNWALFDQWAHPDEILQNHRIIVYPREGYAPPKKTSSPSIDFIEAPLFRLSSTDVRASIAEGRDVSEMIPLSIIEDCRALYTL